MTQQPQTQAKHLTLADPVIARIAQILQEAILTGTDVTDILRSLQLKVEDQKVQLADGYLDLVKEHHNKMLEAIKAMQ